MNELLNRINFQEIVFRNNYFDKITLENCIISLSEYINKNIYSESPFILFSANNHIKTIIAYYAIIKSGRIAVLLDPFIKQLELNEIIFNVDPSAIIMIDNNSILFDYEKEVIFRTLNNKFKIYSDIHDVCTIAYTNAEDGYSKGAMFTVDNILSEIYTMIDILEVSNEYVGCTYLNYSHLYGFLMGCLVSTHSGGKSIIVDFNIFQLSNVLDIIEKYNVTHLYSVPSIYYFLNKTPFIENKIQGIKKICSGGIKLSDFIYTGFLNKTNRKIIEGYGLTENFGCIAINFQDNNRFESFGKAIPGCEISILDENKNICPANQKGEIYIKGHNLFKGYFNDEATNLKVFRNNWFCTGDYGKMDENGFVYYQGLKKNMINTGGINVYPKKIERLLKMHPNVMEITIYSEESILQGHTVGSIVKLKNNTKQKQFEFKDWCIQNITNQILPKTWQFQ